MSTDSANAFAERASVAPRESRSSTGRAIAVGREHRDRVAGLQDILGHAVAHQPDADEARCAASRPMAALLDIVAPEMGLFEAKDVAVFLFDIKRFELA